MKKYSFLKEKNTNDYRNEYIFYCSSKNQETRLNLIKDYLLKNTNDKLHLAILDIDYCKSILNQSFDKDIFLLFLTELDVMFVNNSFYIGFDVFKKDLLKKYFDENSFYRNNPAIHFNYLNYKYASCKLYGPAGIDLCLFYIFYGLFNKNKAIIEEYSKLIIDSFVDILKEDENADLNNLFYSMCDYGKKGYIFERDIHSESAILYLPFLISKEMTHLYTPIEEPKLSDLAKFYNFSNMEKSIRKKILKFLKIEDDTLEKLIPKELESLLTQDNKSLLDDFFIKIKEKTISENLSLSELLSKFKIAFIPREETEESGFTHSNFSNISQNKKNTNLQTEEAPNEGNKAIAMFSDNKQTFSSEERIEINKDATNTATRLLEQNGYIIKSEDSGFLHVLYGSEELFIQIKSSIKDKTIRLTSRDFRHMSEKKDKFRLLVRLNADPIEFSDFLTVKDIFQKQDNIKIAIDNIKNYKDSDLDKFIDSLLYLEGVNFILPFSNTKKIPNGIDSLYENSCFNSDDEI